MLIFAVANLGVHEDLNKDNDGVRLRDVLHGTDFQPGQQWCVNMTQAILLAGGLGAADGAGWWRTTSSCHELLQRAKDRGKVLSWPASGCIALVTNDKEGVHHCVWVAAIEPDGQYVWTVEGNTNMDGSAHGVMVASHRRSVSSLVFIQPS